MKMTDLRAKARAIFGSAIAEPMPKQPNGAKALQQRANARPIPTYKVGGPVKKPMPTPGESVKSGNRMSKQEGDEMRFMEMLEKKKRPMPTPAESVKSGNRMAREEGAEMKKMKMAVGGKVPAPNMMSVAPSPGKGSPKMSAADMYKLKAQELAMKRAPERPMPAKASPQPEVTPTRDRVNTPSVSLTLDRLLKAATPGSEEAISLQNLIRQQREQAKGSPQPEVAPMPEPVRSTPVRSTPEAAPMPTKVGGIGAGLSPKPAGIGAGLSGLGQSKDGSSEEFQAPIKRAKGGKVQTSSDTARKLATEMGGMKKGGKTKPKNGLAVMIAIGSPKKPAKKMDGGPMGYMDGGEPMGYAAGGAGKMRKGQAPIKKAQGGAAKVRKGMMSPEGNIINAMNKMRGK